MTTLNVQDYGAVGDGNNDDRAAIQAAIDDASSGDTVYIPGVDTSNGEYYLIGNGGSGGHGLVIETSVADIVISGDGPTSLLKAADVADDYELVRLNAFGGTMSLTMRNLRLDTLHGSGNSRSGGPGYAAIHVNNNNEETTGHDIHFEDIKMQNVAGAAFLMRGGLETVTGNRLTAVNTDDQHGFQLNSVNDPTDETNIVNTFKSLKAVDIGDPGDSSGNGVNVSGTVLVEDAYFKNCLQGNKISSAGGHPVIRNVRFTEHNNLSALRGVTNSSNDSWTLKLDYVRFENSDAGAINGFNRGGPSTWTVTEMETENCNRSDNSHGHIEIKDDISLNAGTIHSADGGSGVGTFYDSDSSGSIDTLNWQNLDDSHTDYSGNLSVGTVNNQSNPGLAVPGANDVGAYTSSTTPTPTPTATPTATPDDSGFDNWTPRWAAIEDQWGVKSGSSFEGGHALAFQDGGDSARYALSWDTVGAPSDVEILDRFRIPQFNSASDAGYHARVCLRCSTQNGNAAGYWVQTKTPDDAYTLAKYNPDGTLTNLAEFGTPVQDTFLYRRFRAEGDTLKVKIWPADEVEPSTWDVEVTDTDHADGWVGVGSYDPELVETDVVSVGTGGESAPGPDQAPSLSWVNPAEGETVADTETVQVDASDQEDPADTLTVDYRIDGGTWRSTAYNTETGYHEDAWDTTAVADGDHTLEARVTDSSGNTSSSAVTVTVANTLNVATVGAESITDSAATLVGELQSLGGASNATCYFEWRESGTDTWSVVGKQTLSATGQFSADLTGLASATTYEFRAVAETDVTATGSTLSFDTGTSSTSLSIDRFDVTDKSNPAWNWYEVDWAVSDSDAELDTVVSELRNGGTTVTAQSTNVSGSSASFTHELRVKGPVDEITLSVNDTSNESITESKSV